MEQFMKNPILRVDEWLEFACMDPEISSTYGRIYFGHDKIDFTSHRSGADYRQAAYLPAYPLALWVTQSWWRLFYEPKPDVDTYEWSATHCIRFAGYGFLWPDIWLLPDGVNIDILARPHIADEVEPIEYFQRESRGIPLLKIETCFSQFINSTIERLSGIESNLASLWREILRERENESVSFLRKIEAVLGHDPDDIPEKELHALANYGKTMGKNYLLELLTAFRQSGEINDGPVKDKVEDLSHVQGVQGKFNLPTFQNGTNLQQIAQPWDMGRHVARDLRNRAGITGKVNNETLREMIGISKIDFYNYQPSFEAPFFIGKKNNNSYTFIFSKERTESKRFQVARYIGDYYSSLANQQDGEWLIISDCSTFRQKAQRAFGAEFLMPVHLIKEHTGGVYTPANIKKVANEFEVSPILAASQLANHKLIPSYAVELYS
jgi:Zn-dependent peptidase ImmA (M78 family)